ncbi:ankyrin, partial [Anaeromyces robustus]
RLDLLKILVSQNINIELKDKHDYTPLINAIVCRNFSIINYLLEIGADIQPVNLHIKVIEKIIINNDFNILKNLVEHHLDINAKDEEGNTPLIYAIKNRNIEIVEYLLKMGA